MKIREFKSGHIHIKDGVARDVDPDELSEAVERHLSCDWGDIDAYRWGENEDALQKGARLFSVYHSNGVRFWVITAADRTVTTVGLPEEF